MNNVLVFPKDQYHILTQRLQNEWVVFTQSKFMRLKTERTEYYEQDMETLKWTEITCIWIYRGYRIKKGFMQSELACLLDGNWITTVFEDISHKLLMKAFKQGII